ncbi:MAG: APC family permease [Bryobacterales bacterium]|nr:APC family permease [Bryobacterales bacterium]
MGESTGQPRRGDRHSFTDASWEFPGWGTAERLTDLSDSAPPAAPGAHAVHKLGAWKSTAICGNDITSSCLYVSALCALQAGPYAPLALALVAAVLYLFRGIYGEVGSALPLNGGAYNALLNTTSKSKAAVAACLTLLSYIATAVISANEAMHYAAHMVHGLPIIAATIALLGLFALLNVWGISESGAVAVGLFGFHLATLTILALVCGAVVLQSPEVLRANWSLAGQYDPVKALFFGFAAAMLGISGFESSANFIEEQQKGVFRLTLRNMWLAVAVFNPLISLLSLGMVPLAQFGAHKEGLLAEMGHRAAGGWLSALVSVDAVLVLSGAVLTSYVGVTGLVRRLTLDRCLPQVLLKENGWRHTNHWIIVLFFTLCCSILLVSGGQVELLAGVYTLSFLGVMLLFAAGNMLLKMRRAKLPREEKASWGALVLGGLAVAMGIVGNLLLNPEYVRVFGVYFGIAVLAIGVMLVRLQILAVLLAMLRAAVTGFLRWSRYVNIRLVRSIRLVRGFRVIYFSKGDNLETLNNAARYVMENEHSKRLIVVHVYGSEEEIPPALAEHLRTIDKIYPSLRIDVVFVRGQFGPDLIGRLSERMRVPRNYMFIGTPGDRFPHNLAELGGVRLII